MLKIWSYQGRVFSRGGGNLGWYRRYINNSLSILIKFFKLKASFNNNSLSILLKFFKLKASFNIERYIYIHNSLIPQIIKVSFNIERYIYIHNSISILLKLFKFYGLRRHPTFSKKSQLIVVFVLKRSIQPPKNWSFAWKYILFLLKKTSQPPKKLKFCIKKMTKKVPKRPPSPEKTEVLHKKNVYFYSKIPPSLAKNWSFA